MLRWLTFKSKIEKKIVLVMSLEYRPVTQSILCLIFSMYVRTIQYLNQGGWESQKQFAVYYSDTPVTLKQGHQTWYELVYPKQGYNDAKFEKPLLNSIHEKACDKVFCWIRTCPLSPLDMCKVKISGIFMTCLMYLQILWSFNLIR